MGILLVSHPKIRQCHRQQAKTMSERFIFKRSNHRASSSVPQPGGCEGDGGSVKEDSRPSAYLGKLRSPSYAESQYGANHAGGEQKNRPDRHRTYQQIVRKPKALLIPFGRMVCKANFGNWRAICRLGAGRPLGRCSKSFKRYCPIKA